VPRLDRAPVDANVALASGWFSIGLNSPGSSGGSLPEPGDYLIQDANRCGFHVNRWEFGSCPIGRIEVPSEGPLLARADRSAKVYLPPDPSTQLGPGFGGQVNRWRIGVWSVTWRTASRYELGTPSRQLPLCGQASPWPG